jgi:hypothetical protein
VSCRLLQFVEQHCGELTPPQRAMTEWHLKNGTLLGVGRAIGRSIYMPLVRRGPRAPTDVIDGAGYEQTSAVTSRKQPLPLPPPPY